MNPDVIIYNVCLRQRLVYEHYGDTGMHGTDDDMTRSYEAQ